MPGAGGGALGDGAGVAGRWAETAAPHDTTGPAAPPTPTAVRSKSYWLKLLSSLRLPTPILAPRSAIGSMMFESRPGQCCVDQRRRVGVVQIGRSGEGHSTSPALRCFRMNPGKDHPAIAEAAFHDGRSP